MKKISYILGIIILLWFAALGYAHLTTQDKIARYINKVNSIYSANDLGITIALTEFDSHLFGATAEYSIEFDLSKLTGMPLDAVTTKGGEVDVLKALQKPFILNQDISYGPLFFDNGVEFGAAKMSYHGTLKQLLTGAMTLIAAQMEQEISKEELAKMTEEFDALIAKEVNVSYDALLPLFSNNLKMTGKIDEIILQKNKNNKLDIGAITLDATTNIKHFTGDARIVIPHASLKDKGEEVFEMTNLTLDYSIDEFINSLHYFGKFVFDAEKIAITTPEGKTSFHANITSLIRHNAQQQQLSDTNVTFAVDTIDYPQAIAESLPVELPNAVNFSVSLDGINMAELGAAYQKLEQYLRVEIMQEDASTLDTMVQQQILPHLKKSFVIDISTLGVELSFTTPSAADITNSLTLSAVYALSADELSTLINALIANDVIAAQSILMQAAKITLSAHINKSLLMLFNQQLTALKEMEAIVETEHTWDTTIEYNKGVILFNGKENPALLQQLQPLLQGVN